MDSKSEFTKFKFTEKTSASDALQNIVIAFERIDCIEAIYLLMTKALKQDPIGSLIKNIIKDYKLKLAQSFLLK
jgi:hypothetical protein